MFKGRHFQMANRALDSQDREFEVLQSVVVVSRDCQVVVENLGSVTAQKTRAWRESRGRVASWPHVLASLSGWGLAAVLVVWALLPRVYS